MLQMLERSWVRLRKGFLGLGKMMGRKPVASLDLSVGLLVLCLLMIVATFTGVSITAWREWRLTRAPHIQVPVQAHGWKTLRVSSAEDGLANFAALWQSRTERDHSRSLASVKLQSRGESVLWLGTVFNEQELARAFYTQANVLYLGQISGRYRVYLDGDAVTWGSSDASTQPVTIPLPMKRLESGDPLQVAIEIADDRGVLRPDELGGKTGEGFVTPPAAESLIRARVWETESQPLLCAAIFVALGGLFFLSWLTQRQKQEYAVFAVCAFHQGLMQLCSIDIFRGTLGFSFWSSADLVLLIWEGSLGMLLGFSLARMRESWTMGVAAATAIVSVVLFAAPVLSLQPAMLVSWQKHLIEWVIPLAYGRGAVACLIQWNVLSQRRTFAATDRRRRELRRLGIGLLFVGTLYALEGAYFSSSDAAMSLFRLMNFIVVLGCYGAGVLLKKHEPSRSAEFQKAG